MAAKVPSRFKFWPPSRYRRRKLTDVQVDEIRARYDAGEKAVALAGEFGITISYVYRLDSRRARVMRSPDDGEAS